MIFWTLEMIGVSDSPESLLGWKLNLPGDWIEYRKQTGAYSYDAVVPFRTAKGIGGLGFLASFSPWEAGDLNRIYRERGGHVEVADQVQAALTENRGTSWILLVAIGME